jgi:opacity protein-like surface antigen
MKTVLPVLCATALLLLPAMAAHAEMKDEQAPGYQVFLGSLELNDQTGSWDELSDGPVEVEFNNLPSLGIETEYTFQKGWVHWGLNPGGSLSWKNGDANFSGSLTNGDGLTVNAELDNSILLMEVHLGGYIRGRLHERITTYAAAGPMLMYGEHEVKGETLTPATAADASIVSNTDSSAFGVGYYARAGIDFQIREDQHLGLGFRYLNSELDFDKTIGKIDIEGPQFVLTFSKRL